MRHVLVGLVAGAAAFGLCLSPLACGGKSGESPAAGDGAPSAPTGESPAPGTDPPVAKLAADKGVDAASKTIRVAVLNDLSGPAAAIGKPFAVGKQILAAQIAAGAPDILPAGWKLELVTKDHGYNPQKSVQAYNEIKNDVLYVGLSFGTPNTLPLLPLLKRDQMVAFPASLSSQMAQNAHTPPAGPSYAIEARRAVDWVATQAGDKAAIKLGVIYQQDDYGADGLAGLEQQAQKHGLAIVQKSATTPGQKDFAAVITALKDQGATHVLLTTLPSATGPILGTAAQLGYAPVWIGNTPAWVDVFFNPKVIPAAVFGKFHLVTGLPFWGEDVPGMDAFLAAYEAHGKDLGPPDFYTLMSYVQGRVSVEAARRAIASGDITRTGYLAALQSLEDYDAGGLIQPITLTAVPYVTSTKTRVLRPDFAKRSWTSVAPYAVPVE